jgi:hypothetical protein
VADSLVSCMAMIEGGSCGFVIKSCKHGIAVLNDEAFQVMAYAGRLVIGRGLGCCAKLGKGAGWGNVYSVMGSLKRSASVRSWFGRYGKTSCKFCMVRESRFR